MERINMKKKMCQGCAMPLEKMEEITDKVLKEKGWGKLRRWKNN